MVSHTEAKTVGDLQQSQKTAKIIEFLIHLERKGKPKITLKAYSTRLKQLAAKGLNLLEPEEIKEFLSKQKQLSNATKAIDVSIYGSFLKFHKIPWDPPEYKPECKNIFMPDEEELEQLISGAGRRLSVFLMMIKETGCRKTEVAQLKWTDIDFKRKLVSVTTAKRGIPRILPLTERMIGVLGSMNRKTEKIFNASLSSLSSNYYQQRKKLAKKLGNPRLLKIGLHTIRHWKLTKIAHEFRDPFYVQDFAGHRDMKSTLRYVHLEKQIYRVGSSSEFHVAVAKTVDEASRLVGAGYEFVHEHQGVMIYRKRK